jgi:ABC-2 type transport system permease protein
VAVSTLPLAVGLDAMRQLAFAGSEHPFGFLPPEVEGLLLVGMVVVFLALARLFLRLIEHRARVDGKLITRTS